MQEFLSQPWYIYVIGAVAIGIFAYRYFTQGMQEAENEPVKFHYSTESSLTEQQKYGIALHGVLAAYNEMDLNILEWSRKGKISKRLKPYLEGWGIDTKEGYMDMTNYYLNAGRRSLFEAIYPLYKTVPKEEWESKMQEYFGGNQFADRILNSLDTHNIIDILKSHKIIEFDSDMEIGTMAWDISNLVGQARRAYTANVISEDEAWAIINKASVMAKENFNSWQEFGRSLSIGFALDMYKHPMYGKEYFKDYLKYYQATLNNRKSPWNTIAW